MRLRCTICTGTLTASAKARGWAPTLQLKEHEWQGKGQERKGTRRPTPTAPPHAALLFLRQNEP